MMKHYLVIKVSGYAVHKVISLFATALSFIGQHRKCKIIGDEAFRIADYSPDIKHTLKVGLDTPTLLFHSL